MGKFDNFYDDFREFRSENRADHGYIMQKVDDLTERVVKVEIVQAVCEKRQGRLNRMWCAIIGAIGVVIGGIFSLFTTKA